MSPSPFLVAFSLALLACGPPPPRRANLDPATAAPVDVPLPPPASASALSANVDPIGNPTREPEPSRGLLNPSLATERAPDKFKVHLETTAGPLDFACERNNGPHGADRIFNLVRVGYFTDVAFFRVVKSPYRFVAQFGIHGDPAVNRAWQRAKLPADPVVRSNTSGTLTFAQAGAPDSRTTQLFINLKDNTALDKLGFTPICVLTGDAEPTLTKLNGEYGETPTKLQPSMVSEGNAFLRREFPNLDYVMSARVVVE
jgi:peptidyl-prolyl cis-trans isomerase A (cyclophilin A)